MPRLVLAGVWLVVCLVSPLAAQDEPAGTPPDSTDALVLDHDFTAGVNEFVRVFLQSKQVYRAELTTPDVSVVIRTLPGRLEAAQGISGFAGVQPERRRGLRDLPRESRRV